MARVLAIVALGVFATVGCSGGGDRDAATSSSSSTTRPAPANGALVIAHRGASGYAPEHTFAAYDLAVEQGADYLEQDLQLTADGVLVVLHDATLDRTARGPAGSCTGPVSEKTLAQIQECDVGSWFNEAHPERADPAYVGLRIPTLEQVLDRYATDVRYYIEIKALGAGSGMEEPLLDLLGQRRPARGDHQGRGPCSSSRSGPTCSGRSTRESPSCHSCSSCPTSAHPSTWRRSTRPVSTRWRSARLVPRSTRRWSTLHTTVASTSIPTRSTTPAR